MYAQVLSTRQANSRELLLLQLVLWRLSTRNTVLHQSLQLGQGLLDFGHRS